MDERALFTKFWENEAKTTHKVLARIPEGSDYRPDPKSRTASEIAWQIACEEKMIIEALETGKVEWNPAPAPKTMKELIDVYERQSADIIKRWKALPAARWDGTLDVRYRAAIRRRQTPVRVCVGVDAHEPRARIGNGGDRRAPLPGSCAAWAFRAGPGMVDARGR